MKSWSQTYSSANNLRKKKEKEIEWRNTKQLRYQNRDRSSKIGADPIIKM